MGGNLQKFITTPQLIINLSYWTCDSQESLLIFHAFQAIQ